ncbi:Phosphodiest-domain-containing protein [Sporormia fimetaria CBS 119925]|uniref:Phosphodiest-domain-containing protein n=1 Tax=Sporormia fimetaria CBS 119925 TaxID=1340428 RepID=A0A6A6VK52_9PLEO|nr:Phosphodiest-domain-containing protein [Sporormia fimetaria CBS 119925]
MTRHDDGDELEHARQSSEMSVDDHDILESEDERERLLTKHTGVSGIFGTPKVRIGTKGRQQADDDTREDEERPEGETSGLLYDTEEDVGASKKRLCVYGSILTAILVFFLVLAITAYRLSQDTTRQAFPTMVSNGTSLFAPTTILISLDGFRADFLYRGLTPTLNSFIQEGISPKYMLPSFPSVTFPNHYTMVTGLYPESHGIVSNTFWDPKLKKDFYYTDPKRSLQSFWWSGEPLWATAERQNVRAAVHMWPGSEAAADVVPTHLDKYSGKERLPLKVDRILELLDLPGPMDAAAEIDRPRPQLIAAYVPNVDGDGHKYGPNSTEIRQTIRDADSMLGSILAGLQERNLTDIVNVVVVSDHGMATTDVERLIQLEDLVDPADLDRVDGWPLYGLRPKNISNLNRMHSQLVEKVKDNPNIDVYLRDKDMPARYHFSNNDRIAPLWIVPKTGWAIVDKTEFNIAEAKKTGQIYHPRGLHGYDFEHPLMRAIFVARGPAFPHKPNSRVEPFQNIELYNIVCDSIGIEPRPNNGTLRLPLRPVGLHTDPDTPPDETPQDPVTSSTPSSTPLPSLSSLSSTASAIQELVPSSHIAQPASPTTRTAPEPSSHGGSSIWDWITHQAEELEEWVDGIIHGHEQGKSKADTSS